MGLVKWKNEFYGKLDHIRKELGCSMLKVVSTESRVQVTARWRDNDAVMILEIKRGGGQTGFADLMEQVSRRPSKHKHLTVHIASIPHGEFEIGE